MAKWAGPSAPPMMSTHTLSLPQGESPWVPWSLGAAGLYVAAGGWGGPESPAFREHWLRQSRKGKEGEELLRPPPEHALVRAVFGVSDLGVGRVSTCLKPHAQWEGRGHLRKSCEECGTLILQGYPQQALLTADLVWGLLTGR